MAPEQNLDRITITNGEEQGIVLFLKQGIPLDDLLSPILALESKLSRVTITMAGEEQGIALLLEQGIPLDNLLLPILSMKIICSNLGDFKLQGNASSSSQEAGYACFLSHIGKDFIKFARSHWIF